MIRAFRSFDSKPRTRGQINNIVWPKNELLEIARLLDRLEPPNFRHPELYFEQRSALSHELRRLARWAHHSV